MRTPKLTSAWMFFEVTRASSWVNRYLTGGSCSIVTCPFCGEKSGGSANFWRPPRTFAAFRFLTEFPMSPLIPYRQRFFLAQDFDHGLVEVGADFVAILGAGNVADYDFYT